MHSAASLVPRLEAHLKERPDLLPRGSRVLVALSGGPDSMVLLDLLVTLRKTLGIELQATHFDHGVRSGSSAEAETVVRWAAELGVACTLGSSTAQRAPGASRPGRPTQAGLRDLRYAFLNAEAERTSSDRLATGHHADDQAETVLFRFLRGTGLRGLGGIPAHRGRVVRPLIPFGRSDIEQHLRARHLPCLRDPSNLDPRWARTRLRHVALPALEHGWRGDAALRLTELARAASEADAALDDVAWRALLSARRDTGPEAEASAATDNHRWSFSADRLAPQDDELLARGLRRLARRAGVRLRSGGTEAGVQFIKRGRSGAEIDLGGGLRMWREFATLSVGVPSMSTLLEDRLLVVTSRTNGSGSLRLGGRAYRAEWSVGADRDPGARSVIVPGELLRFPLEMRSRRPGDRIRLAKGSRTLKRLFNDLRVPRRERGRIPILAHRDTVLWAYGLAVASGLQIGTTGGSAEPALTVRIAPSFGASEARTETCNNA